MRNGRQQHPGAKWPPLRLVCPPLAAALRFIALVVATLAVSLVLLLPSGHSARAQGTSECRYVGSGPIGAEGFDGPDTFGFRLTLRKQGWGWGPAQGGAVAACPLCATGVAKGILRIGMAPFYAPSDEYVLRRETGQQEASAVEFALHPRTMAIGLWSMTNFMPREIVPESDITPVKILSTDGMARAFRIVSTGAPVYGVALAIKDRCFQFFGLFFRENNAPLAVSDLPEVDEFLELQKYTPRFSLDQLTPRPPPPPRIPFPLGDARKRLMEDEKTRDLLK
jgi:hypothetical protein